MTTPSSRSAAGKGQFGTACGIASSRASQRPRESSLFLAMSRRARFRLARTLLSAALDDFPSELLRNHHRDAGFGVVTGPSIVLAVSAARLGRGNAQM
jgi:hypothetical protein